MEYPKAIYHPKDGKRYQIANTADHEQQIREEFGISSAPKISLSFSAQGAQTAPAADKPKAQAKPKAKRAAKPKATGESA
ncbi:hypothetical protein LZK73_18385 [Neorhizobium galegae]|nr:hypothetical protein LZK73_18385 [Neorhizobium galegae]